MWLLIIFIVVCIAFWLIVVNVTDSFEQKAMRDKYSKQSKTYESIENNFMTACMDRNYSKISELLPELRSNFPEEGYRRPRCSEKYLRRNWDDFEAAYKSAYKLAPTRIFNSVFDHIAILQYTVTFSQDVDLIRALINGGENVNGVSGIRQDPLLPLWQALKYNSIEVISCLVEEGADVNRRQFMRRSSSEYCPSFSPLQWVCLFRPESKLIALLIDNGACFNKREYPEPLEITQRFGVRYTHVMLPCREDCPHLVDRAHEDPISYQRRIRFEGFPGVLQTIENCSPLVGAISSGSDTACNQLLAQESVSLDCNIRINGYATTPRERLEPISPFGNYCFNLSRTRGKDDRPQAYCSKALHITSILLYAMLHDSSPNIIKLLLRHGADVNNVGSHFLGETCSVYWSGQRNEQYDSSDRERSIFLIPPKRYLFNGDTPLTIAARYSTSLESFKAVYEQTEKPMNLIIDGKNCLDFALICGDENIANYLIGMGFLPTSINEFQQINPEYSANQSSTHLLRFAEDASSGKIIEHLIHFGADVSVCYGTEHRSGMWSGKTPLHIAANCNNSPSVTAALLKSGSKIDAQDSNGSTPLMLSAKNTNQNIKELLVSSGADTSIRDFNGKSFEDYTNSNYYPY